MRLAFFISGWMIGSTLIGWTGESEWISTYYADRIRPQTSEEWKRDARLAVELQEQFLDLPKTAKNLILFLGDGMSLPTVTAARILEGQKRGESGEENFLSFERLPFTGIVKTYNTDQQTPDSAGTMTAIVTGTKTRAGLIGVASESLRGDPQAAFDRPLINLFELAQRHGKKTGIVTTTRLTHATPACCFSHSPERDWENDKQLNKKATQMGYPDIAVQFLEPWFGHGIDFALAGGRENFIPNTLGDVEYPNKKGLRTDGRHLIHEWLEQFPEGRYVWNQEGLENLDLSSVSRVLGLFEPGHMNYEVDRVQGGGAGEPSLSRMTEKALEFLAKAPDGFVLLVEGGRIDHAHHDGHAQKALLETIEFSNAVRVAMRLCDPSETMILVTSDHSHTLTIAGYPTRGNDILGWVRKNDSHGHPEADYAKDKNGFPYTTLTYANGLGHRTEGKEEITLEQIACVDYRQDAAIPLDSETHGGDDVAVYAGGAGAMRVRGVLEQNVLYYYLVKGLGLDRAEPPARNPIELRPK